MGVMSTIEPPTMKNKMLSRISHPIKYRQLLGQLIAIYKTTIIFSALQWKGCHYKHREHATSAGSVIRLICTKHCQVSRHKKIKSEMVHEWTAENLPAAVKACGRKPVTEKQNWNSDIS